MRNSYSTFFLLIAVFTAFFANPLIGDTIKMKDGKVHEGTITYEAADITKIEVQISASIKETKVLSTDQIAEVIKAAPDDVDFAKLQKLVPTPSLLSTDRYKSMLDTSVRPFLAAHPDSKHKPKVEEMLKTLEEELDKVERGSIKVEGEWYSPKDKANFQLLIESRIKYLAMQSKMNQGTYNGFIGAMRDFEQIEKNYVGTPAYPKAITAARSIVPALGRQLQNMQRDVETRNMEFEKNKAILNDYDRQQVEAARANEEKQYQAGLNLDKKAGIKWVRLNPRSKASIDGYLSLAKNELDSLKSHDVEALAEQAEKLVEVDKLIASGQLDRAKSKFADATSISVGSGKKKSSKKKGSGSYIAALNSKLSEKLAKRAATEKALEEAKESEALAKDLANSKNEPIIPDAVPTEMKKDGEEGTEETEEVAKPKKDAFAALSQSSKKAEKKPTKSTSSKKKKPSKKEEEEEEEDRPRRSSGGGFKIQYLIMGLTAVMVIAVVLMKVLGIGGKKEE